MSQLLIVGRVILPGDMALCLLEEPLEPPPPQDSSVSEFSDWNIKDIVIALIDSLILLICTAGNISSP
jgi:hypothetical protein